MRIAIVIAWLALILLSISYLLWHSEWKYSLPTPVPSNYHEVQIGDRINLVSKLFSQIEKPTFIHFFNPDCPCSKFNIPHFKSLVKKYGDKINFEIVVLYTNNKYTVADINDKFNLTIPVSFDSGIATECGVYSTPQAVIIDAHQQLYFRGNYNKSRFCTAKSSNYAQMAIESLLTNNHSSTFNQYALQAYGCQLPTCTR